MGLMVRVIIKLNYSAGSGLVCAVLFALSFFNEYKFMVVKERTIAASMNIKIDNRFTCAPIKIACIVPVNRKLWLSVFSSTLVASINDCANSRSKVILLYHKPPAANSMQ